MKNIWIIVLVIAVNILVSQRSALSFDEETFYEYAVFSTIYMHDAEKAGKLELPDYMGAMKEKFPDFMSDGWKTYGDNISKDPVKQGEFCLEVVRRLTEKGYKSEILEVGPGLYTVQIVDDDKSDSQ